MIGAIAIYLTGVIVAWIVHVNDTSLTAAYYPISILLLAWLASECYLVYVLCRYKAAYAQDAKRYWGFAFFLAIATFVICGMMSSK